MQNTKNSISGSLLQQAAARSHQQMQQAQHDLYARGYTDPRSYMIMDKQ
jgi:hypothetical protein